MTKKLKETKTEKVVTLVPPAPLSRRETERRCVCTHLAGSHDGVDGRCRMVTFGNRPCDCETFRAEVSDEQES
jgi:hypothetical protein